MGLFLNESALIFFSTILSIIMLYFGASLLISGALSAASKLKISETVISITLIAGATSLPELFVLLKAIQHPNGSTMAYGTVLGSNLANLGLVLGLSILIKFKDKFSFNFLSFKNFIPISIASTLIFCIYGLNISDNLWIKKILSIAMILAIFTYIFKSKEQKDDFYQDGSEKNITNKKIFSFVFIGGMLLAFGSGLLVDVGIKLQNMGISSAIIGSIYFALASSSPEIFTSLFAIFKYKKHNVVVGNVLGSNLANIFIFGLIALIFKTESIIISKHSPILLLILETSLFSVFLLYYIYNKKYKIIQIHSIIGFLLFYVYYLFYKSL